MGKSVFNKVVHEFMRIEKSGRASGGDLQHLIDQK